MALVTRSDALRFVLLLCCIVDLVGVIVLCVVIGIVFCKCLLCLLWLNMFSKLFIVSVRVGHAL